MQIRLADYVANFLVENGITNMFTVTGGGAMNLNDAFGHKDGLKCTYFHHEQACAIAGEAYARINNHIAAVCVTTGPGGTNAITGVVGAYTDSIPMLVISGQVKYCTTARSTSLPLRCVGDQEFDITKAVSSMTKYAVMVVDPNEIKYHLQKALFLAYNGRPGPVWLDIPGDVQSAKIETDNLKDYNPLEDEIKENPPYPSDDTINTIIEKLKTAKRPVIYAGSAIRYAGCHEEFLTLARKLNIPVVTAWNSIDNISSDDSLFVGRGGNMGDRAGNFAVQNADCILSLGCRLSIRQVGYEWKTWAREAYVIMVDIDKYELQKPTLHVELPVHANVKDVIRELNRKVTDTLCNRTSWLKTCAQWKKKYPVVLKEYYKREGLTNPYCFIEQLSKRLDEEELIVVGNGTACVVGSHGITIKNGQRFIINSGIASMGYDLPAAIGVALCCPDKRIILITGDGSIQMNLQELQTIKQNKLNIKIFLINNDGYHSIRQSQNNFFKGRPTVGIGPESGDLSFPDFKRIAWAYEYPFKRCSCNKELARTVKWALENDGYCLAEIMTDPTQNFEPKSSSKILPDGKIVSPPLEDLAPFLPEEELKRNMFISPVEKI